MSDAVWIRLQATCRCQACAATTPVNAAVERLDCAECGAEFSLREELWDNILAEAQQVAAELDANATSKRDYDAAGMLLNVAIAAVDASCPHCGEAWSVLPKSGCPACGEVVSVRAFSAGTLVGEDRHILARTRAEAEPQTMSCSGCGAALVADGRSRELSCGACGRSNVVPDEIWRRVHAPSSVASWWLYAGGGRTRGLSARVRAQEMVGGKGVVYVLGGYGDSYAALMAIEVEPLGLRWMVDLQQLGKEGLMHLAGFGNRLFGYREMSKAVEVFDADTGHHIETMSAPEPLTDLCADSDGTLIGRTMTGAMIRMDAKGQAQELWGTRGFFSKIFGGDGIVEEAPTKKMRGLSTGRIGMGLDGELRVISRRWVGRLGRDGDLRWSVAVEGANIAIVAPASSADGSTFAVLRTVGGSMTLEQFTAFHEAIADGVDQSSSVLVRIPASGGKAEVVRRSGAEEFTALAVTHAGEQWLATGEGALIRLAPSGELLWRQGSPED